MSTTIYTGRKVGSSGKGNRLLKANAYWDYSPCDVRGFVVQIMLFAAAFFVQIGAKATVSCSLGTNCIVIPGLCANQGDHSNHGPAIENGTKPIPVLSPGTTELEIVHPYVYSISLRVLYNSALL